MPLEAPKLDTRTFEELYNQARLRIPRYTPEWTDFNESDPGITLLQLFAWLTDMMLYQINRVPKRNYIKFLKLLGKELNPAQPATAHVTFTAQAGAVLETVGVPALTQISAQPADGGEPLVFETERELDLIKVPLKDVRVFDSTSLRKITENDVDGKPFRPFGWTPQVGNALYLGFTQTDPPVHLRAFPREIRFRVFLPAAAQAGKAQRCDESLQPIAQISRSDSQFLEPILRAIEDIVIDKYVPESRRDMTLKNVRSAINRALGWRVQPPVGPPVNLVWEYKERNDVQYWRRLNVYDDQTSNFTKEGYIVVEGPADIEPTVPYQQITNGEENNGDRRYWIRCRLETGSYPAGGAPEIDFIRPNTVEALNLSTVRDEIVGISEGVPDQSFDLRYKPVQRDSLEIEVENEQEIAGQWERVDDFLASKAEDRHFVMNPTTGKIYFGNGIRGLIPAAGTEIVARKYRYGGGAAGNIAKGTISALMTSPPGVDQVTNERPAVGGRDEQPIEDLITNAPAIMRSRNRAVTAEDFSALASEIGEVAKATAIPLAHPDHPGVKVPGAVTVVIVPDSADMPPQPSSNLIEHVGGQLNRYRLLTTELYVKGPEYQEIKVEVRVAAEPYASFDSVARNVKNSINFYLDPLGRKHSETPAAEISENELQDPCVSARQKGWEFGKELYPTNLYSVVLNVTAVAAVRRLQVFVNGRPHEPLTEPVVVPLDGLVFGAQDHEVVVVPLTDL